MIQKYLSLCLLIVSLAGCNDYSEDLATIDAIIGDPVITPVAPEADGESKTLIEIQFPQDADAGKTSVELRTTSGIFKESGKDMLTLFSSLEQSKEGKIQRIARTYLINPISEGQATLSARVAGYIKNHAITFRKSFPDSLAIESDKLALKKGAENTATVTVSLLRGPGRGKAALFLPIVLMLQDSEGNSHGLVNPSNVLSGPDGKCKFLITRGSDPYTGDLYVQAICPDNKLRSASYKILSIN